MLYNNQERERERERGRMNDYSQATPHYITLNNFYINNSQILSSNSKKNNNNDYYGKNYYSYNNDLNYNYNTPNHINHFLSPIRGSSQMSTYQRRAFFSPPPIQPNQKFKNILSKSEIIPSDNVVKKMSSGKNLINVIFGNEEGPKDSINIYKSIDIIRRPPNIIENSLNKNNIKVKNLNYRKNENNLLIEHPQDNIKNYLKKSKNNNVINELNKKPQDNLRNYIEFTINNERFSQTNAKEVNINKDIKQKKIDKESQPNLVNNIKEKSIKFKSNEKENSLSNWDRILKKFGKSEDKKRANNFAFKKEKIKNKSKNNKNNNKIIKINIDSNNMQNNINLRSIIDNIKEEIVEKDNINLDKKNKKYDIKTDKIKNDINIIKPKTEVIKKEDNTKIDIKKNNKELNESKMKNKELNTKSRNEDKNEGIKNNTVNRDNTGKIINNFIEKKQIEAKNEIIEKEIYFKEEIRESNNSNINQDKIKNDNNNKNFLGKNEIKESNMVKNNEVIKNINIKDNFKIENISKLENNDQNIIMSLKDNNIRDKDNINENNCSPYKEEHLKNNIINEIKKEMAKKEEIAIHRFSSFKVRRKTNIESLEEKVEDKNESNNNNINTNNASKKKNKVIKQNQLFRSFDEQGFNSYKQLSQKPVEHSLELQFVLDPQNYKYLGVMGEGEYGKIYLAQSIKDNQYYAMKIETFKNRGEAHKSQMKTKMVKDLLKKIKSGGICKIYGDIWLKKNNLYYYYVLMEKAEKDMEQELVIRGNYAQFYSEVDLTNVLCQLILTCSQLQKNNIAHRDIKPQNILILGGWYKLCDFGEAKSFNKTGVIIQKIRGTELYMSPILFFGLKKKFEQVKHNAYKSDVFSLGLCILLAGSLNYDSICQIRELTDMEAIKNIIMYYLSPRYSISFISFLLQMLEVDENKRPDFIQLEASLVRK